MPREITVSDGKIRCNPVREMERLRDRIVADDQTEDLKGQYELLVNDIQSEQLHIELADGMKLSYENGVLNLELTEQAGAGRKIRKMKIETLEELRIFVDVSICEIYVNHGEAVMTSRFYGNVHEPVIEENGQVASTLWALDGQIRI